MPRNPDGSWTSLDGSWHRTAEQVDRDRALDELAFARAKGLWPHSMDPHKAGAETRAWLRAWKRRSANGPPADPRAVSRAEWNTSRTADTEQNP